MPPRSPARVKPIELPFGAHYNGIRHLADVHTARDWTIEMLTGGVQAALKANSICLVTGETGSGKSYGVARALETLLATESRRLCWLDFSDWDRGLTLLRDLREQLVGDGLSWDMKPPVLRRELRAILSDEPWMLVLDDAQQANSKALLILAKLTDVPGATFSLVIIATPRIRSTYPEECWSRTLVDPIVDLLADDEVVGVLSDFHPVFAAASEEAAKKIVSINRVFARGHFRWWAELLALWDQLRDEYGWDLTPEFLDVLATTVTRPDKPGARRRKREDD